jgi:hypothetical protein
VFAAEGRGGELQLRLLDVGEDDVQPTVEQLPGEARPMPLPAPESVGWRCMAGLLVEAGAERGAGVTRVGLAVDQADLLPRDQRPGHRRSGDAQPGGQVDPAQSAGRGGHQGGQDDQVVEAEPVHSREP